jgi:2-iminobutanoate/2-iminopropanoate deaminase
MNKFTNPQSIAEPSGPYTHSVEIPPGARMLYVSGQVGVRKDGTTPATIEEQAEVVWTNIKANLAAAGMGMGDLVKITTLVTKAENWPKYAAVRAKFLEGAKPASTGMIVAALVKPEWLIEIEAVAAKAP